MSVEKFTNADEARDALWSSEPGATIAERVRAHWQRCSRLAPAQRRLGVRKFRCIEDAQLERVEIRKANALRLRSLRAQAVEVDEVDVSQVAGLAVLGPRPTRLRERK